jgi:penicillin-binding protein 2
MWAVVNEGGTGGLARLPGVEVCGKTATAQVVSRPKEGSGPRGRQLMDHAWFVCFAPETDPQIAIVVLAEHGGAGGVAAAQIARHILQGIFSSGTEAKAGSTRNPSPEKSPNTKEVRINDG